MGEDAFSKCHPLTNFVYFLGAIGFTVVIQHPAYLTASCLAGGAYLLLLRGRKGLGTILGMLPVFLLLSAVNPLFNTLGEHVLFTVFSRPYTWEALCYGMAIGGMFLAMAFWFGCYSAVLTSDKFICLFGNLIPSVSLMLVMILRMIPSFTRKGAQLLQARRSVGKGLGAGSSGREALGEGGKLLSALTDWALEGSIVTADSMRARGYGTGKRSSFRIYRMRGEDLCLLAVSLLLAGLVIGAGGMGASFTPRLDIDEPTWGLAAYCLYLSLPLILHGKEALQWRAAVSRL